MHNQARKKQPIRAVFFIFTAFVLICYYDIRLNVKMPRSTQRLDNWTNINDQNLPPCTGGDNMTPH